MNVFRRYLRWAGFAVLCAALFAAGIEVGRGRASIAIPEGLASGAVLLERATLTGTTLYTTSADGSVLYVWIYNTQTKRYDATKYDFVSKLVEEVKFGETPK